MPRGNHPNNFIAGQIFGKLTVIEYAGTDKRRNRLFSCQCVCGSVSIYPGAKLKNGETQACKKCGQIRHGESIGKVTKEYKAYAHIKERCYNPTSKSYKNYGGKGIKVCDKWLESFENFLADMGRAPSPSHTLDRFPNNKGDYEPTNCRWTNWYEQQNNRTNNKKIEYNGIYLTTPEWERRLGVSRGYIAYRVGIGQILSSIIKKENLFYVAPS